MLLNESVPITSNRAETAAVAVAVAVAVAEADADANAAPPLPGGRKNPGTSEERHAPRTCSLTW